MNKDVIYVEPEDDITDIISKLESAKEKIIALIPPKKAGVLRSVVNIKLIYKTAAAAGKTVVLVTGDQSIIKLAASVHMPITKDLQTAPHIPTSEDIEDDIEPVETISEEVIEEDEDVVSIKDSESIQNNQENLVDSATIPQSEQEKTKNNPEDDKEPEEDEESQEHQEPQEEDQENTQSKEIKEASRKNSKKPNTKPFHTWLQNHKKPVIVCSSIAGVLVLVLIWALFIAPSVIIDVKIRTVTNNFSEVVSFTETQTEEKADEGKFYLETLKTESPIKIEFDPTGSKNVGNQASGQLTIYAYFSGTGKISIPNNATFTYNNNNYNVIENTTLEWDGAIKNCNNTVDNIKDPCLISLTVDAIAIEGGSRYNAPASESGWSTSIPNISAYSATGFEGGTDKTITVVQQSDVETAKKQISIISEDESKKKLDEQVTADRIVIRNTFKQETTDITVYPNIGEEIPDGEKPYISLNTIATMHAIDKTSVETFIKTKAKLNENYKIYTMNDPYIENFLAVDGGFTGKLKTSYTSGLEITENNILEQIKGRRIGDAQHDLKSIDGVTEIKIEKSFPWVFSIPNDSNKITINLEIEE